MRLLCKHMQGLMMSKSNILLALQWFGLVILGIFLTFQNGWVPKIFGGLCIIFFGGGAIVLLGKLLLAKKNTTKKVIINIKKPESILVKRNPEPDEEVLEEWHRACTLADAEFQMVHATKYNWERFSWGVTFGLAYCIRQQPYADIIAADLTQALLEIPGVKEAVREDTEKWLIEGEVTGEALIRNGSVAVDTFLNEYQHKL